MHKTLVAVALILSTAFAASLADITIPTISTATSYASSSGIAIYGAASMKAGAKVARAGDFDNDGTQDYLVTGDGSNKVYIILGKTPARAAVLDLTGTQGTDFLLITVTANTNGPVTGAGYAGDVNGDGVADIVIAQSASNIAYVVYGKHSSTWSTWDTGATGYDIATAFATGARGIRIKAGTGSNLGEVVSYAGDFNGDGKDDVAIGYSGYTTQDGSGAEQNQGAICIVWGKALAAVANLGSASSGTARGNSEVDCTSKTTLDGTGSLNEGILIVGAPQDHAGTAVAFVGDVNGDGKKDIIIGAKAANKAYIVYGLAATSQATIDLADTATPLKYTKITGPTSGSTSFATALTGNADFNGDLKPDVVIGHPAYDSTKTDAGRVYVIFGTATTGGVALDAIDFSGTVAAARAIHYTGPLDNGYFGSAVALGDVNKDGPADLIVGAPYILAQRAANSGKVYAIYGKAGAVTTDLSTTALTQANGITITGPSGTSFGVSVAAVDVTKDDLADIIVGAPEGLKPSGTANGLVFEIRGSATETPANPASGFRLHASLLVLASFFIALMF